MLTTTNVGRSPITQPGYRKGEPAHNAGRKFPPQPLTELEVLALLEQYEPRGSGWRSRVRDRALLIVLWRGGLRIAEALALEPQDVDLDVGTLAVLHGKGDEWRIVGLDHQALDELRRWLDVRAQVLELDDPLEQDGRPLFCTITHDPEPGRPMQAPAFREALKLKARRARIRKRVTPHSLRHTHATELALENVPLHIIQDQLGHRDLSTTARYIARLAPVARVRLLQQRTWGHAQGSREQGEQLLAQRLIALSGQGGARAA